MVYSLPGQFLAQLVLNLREAGEKVGARYPIPFYVNFQPEFPKLFKELGKEIGLP
jgi:hypothetical protein